MVHIVVIYPDAPGVKFDMEYYLGKHTPLLWERMGSMGLQAVDLYEGVGGIPPGSPVFAKMTAVLTFSSLDAFQNAMAAHGPEIIGDILNFTDIQPRIQVAARKN